MAVDRSLSARRGFTVIELLIVVGIIIVLAGMLFPVLGITRGQAVKRRTESLLTTVHRGLQQHRDLYGEWPRVLADPDYLTANGLAASLCHESPDPALRQGDFLSGEIERDRLRDRDGDGVMDDIVDAYPTAAGTIGRALVFVEYSTYQNPNRPVPVGPSDEVAFENRAGSDRYVNPIAGYRHAFELWSAGKDGALSATRGASENADDISVTAPYGEFAVQ